MILYPRRFIVRTMTLNKEQIEQFHELGWIKIENAIPRDLALEAQDELWGVLNKEFAIERDNRTTWKKAFYLLREHFSQGIFRECSTNKLIESINDLVGEDRLEVNYSKEGIPFGWWPINLYLGANEEWDVPIGGWHWDGMHFRNCLNSKGQGLLMIAYFSDVETRGGATLIAQGTHKLVAKFLSEYPNGLEYKDALPMFNRSHPWIKELTNSYDDISESDRKVIVTSDLIRKPKSIISESRIDKFIDNEFVDENGVRLKVIEATGVAGDVFLCHPFIYHSGSPNHSNQPRLMCNRNIPLNEDMNLNRIEISLYSILEISIKKALDFRSE